MGSMSHFQGGEGRPSHPLTCDQMPFCGNVKEHVSNGCFRWMTAHHDPSMGLLGGPRNFHIPLTGELPSFLDVWSTKQAAGEFVVGERGRDTKQKLDAWLKMRYLIHPMGELAECAWDFWRSWKAICVTRRSESQATGEDDQHWSIPAEVGLQAHHKQRWNRQGVGIQHVGPRAFGSLGKLCSTSIDDPKVRSIVEMFEESLGQWLLEKVSTSKVWHCSPLRTLTRWQVGLTYFALSRDVANGENKAKHQDRNMIVCRHIKICWFWVREMSSFRFEHFLWKAHIVIRNCHKTAINDGQHIYI